jgi:predicted NUDIX family NTP pyrophosphohydrolase
MDNGGVNLEWQARMGGDALFTEIEKYGWITVCGASANSAILVSRAHKAGLQHMGFRATVEQDELQACG